MPTSTLFFFTIVAFATGDHWLTFEGPGPAWARRRTRAVSNTGPIANAINRDDAGEKSVSSLISHFRNVGYKMNQLKGKGYAKTRRQTICEVNDKSVPWYKLSSRLGPYGFLPFRSKCITDLSSENANIIIGAIKELSGVLRRRRDDIITNAGVGWQDAYYFSDFKYNTFAQNCSLYYVPALRVHSRWVLFTSMTRFERSNNTRNRGRPFLDELIGVNHGRLFNLPIHAQIGEHKDNSTVTTVESVWDGVPLPTVFGVLPDFRGKDLRKNPAIDAALESSSKWLEQVESSYNAANIATMTFSCIVAFIPLSFFHEAKLHAVFFYVLFTDIFTCAPLAIKGIELIHFSSRSHQAVRTRVYGLDYNLDLGVAEVFAASCSAPKNVYWTGVKFVIFASLAMVIGIVLEVIMLNRVKIRKRRMKKLAMADRTWAKNTTCSMCLCTHSLYATEGTRGAHAASKFLFRIPSRKLPVPYHLEDGWSGVLSL